MGRRKKENRPSDHRNPGYRTQRALAPAEPCGSPAESFSTVLAICGFLLLAVALVFGQTLQHGFVNYDDEQYTYENPHVIHGLTIKNVGWAFTGAGYASNWHPLTWLSHMLDWQLYGRNAGGHHLTNVLLHAANTLLLFVVLRRMTGALWPSAFVAAVFAIHPLRVESVAWVAERKDVLSGLFFMLTLAAYVGYARHPFSILRYLAVVVLFALGLMSKPMLVTLPFVLLLLDYWPLGRMSLGRESSSGSRAATAAAAVPRSLRRFPWRLIVEKLPLLVLTAASCVVTSLAQSKAMIQIEAFPLSSRIANAAVSYVAYVGQFFYPFDLTVFYPYAKDGLPNWKILASFLLLLGISVAVVVWRRRFPYLLVGWLWYLGMLIPVIGLVQVGSQAMADRYTYLAHIGLYVAIVWGAAEAVASWGYRRWAWGVASVAVLILMGCAWRQTSYWCDSETLWRRTLACTSRNDVANINLGNALARRKQVDEAIRCYREALAINPGSYEIHYNLGLVLMDRGQVDDAIFQYREALNIKPNHAEAHFNLANALAGHGQGTEAITHYEQALKARPAYAEAHNNLGVALLQRGKIVEAVAELEMALKFKPDDAEAHNNLGFALAKQRKASEAAAQFKKALELKPDYAEAHDNLGLILSARGQIDEAIDQFQTALKIQPDFAEAHNSLGAVLVARGEIDNAITHFRRAVESKPALVEPYDNLGRALMIRGQRNEALKYFRKAVEIGPDNLDARNNLATCLYQKGQVAEAVGQWREVVRQQPKQCVIVNQLAWVLATCPEAAVRNGPEAIALAQRAVELSGGREPTILDTLAAAYAEAGRFSDAANTAQKAADLATQQNDKALADAIRARILLYRAKTPYREVERPSGFPSVPAQPY